MPKPILEDPKKSLHSFRHLVTDHLYKASVMESMIEELTGRAVFGRLPVQSVLPSVSSMVRSYRFLIRQEHRAGEKMFVDYAAQTADIYDLPTKYIPITPQNP